VRHHRQERDPPEPSGRDAKAQAWHGPTLPAHAPLLGDLREANEQLVIAALSAQQLEARARETHHRQVAFLAMVAHELRNPLVPIRTAAELLARAQLDDTMLPRLHVIIMRQVRHMSRLIDDLLDGSRAGTGTFRLQSSAVEMAQILDLAVETCRPAMESRQQHLSVQMPQGPLVVNGDAMRLAQVFSNLLDNASKYTPRGGSISLTSSVHGDALAITVSDNGIGITAEALPRIFELFVQDERARVLHSGGLGIGLAVVRDLVEAHGGSVIGRSAGTDQGSEFVVKLPLVESAVAVPD
jgi:signal transduction histidine kinase